MTLPAPLPGLVLRYSYLWARDLVARDATTQTARVYVLPITHSQPATGVEGIEIPAIVAKAAGIDAARSWVIVSEFNEFAWPGFDLALVPGRKPATVAHGFLTPGFFAKVRDRWLAADAAAKSRAVARDE